MAKLKYNEDFPKIAEDLARQGWKDEDIWKKLGISKNTFYEYQNKFPDFRDALKRGKAPVDFEVENFLLQRAKGYEYEEVQIEYKPAAKGQKPQPTSIKRTKKKVPPDTTAQIFWLKNRRPDKWRDRQERELIGNFDTDAEMTVHIIKTDEEKPKKEKEDEKVSD